MALVEVSELVVHHGDVVAVDGASFTAAAGAVTVLLGPNGAGKTSTIDCLEGFRRPTAGTVRVCGLDPVADHAAARLVGITAATYGCLREELLFQPELLEEVQEGLNDLFEHGTGITSARMRIQRMWNEFLLED